MSRLGLPSQERCIWLGVEAVGSIPVPVSPGEVLSLLLLLTSVRALGIWPLLGAWGQHKVGAPGTGKWSQVIAAGN